MERTSNKDDSRKSIKYNSKNYLMYSHCLNNPDKKEINENHNVTTTEQYIQKTKSSYPTSMVTSTPHHKGRTTDISNIITLSSSDESSLSNIMIISSSDEPSKQSELCNTDISEIMIISSSKESLKESVLSNVSLIGNANSGQDIDDDEMKMEMELLISDQDIPDNIQAFKHASTYESLPEANVTNNVHYVKNPSENNIYIVIDSNVFIDNLQIINNILNITFCDDSRPVIYVPWMVFQELDYFNEGYTSNSKRLVSEHLQKQCKKAIQFINDCLVAQRVNFIGESAMQFVRNIYQSRSPDDLILGSCLRVAKQNTTIVLTSDINLRNKCMINKIQSLCPTKAHHFLMNYKQNKSQVDLVLHVSKALSLLLTFIFNNEDKSGNIYSSWDFKMCVMHIKNSYDILFKREIQKQCRKVVNDLYFMLSSDNINEDAFVELSLSLLIYLKAGKQKYGSKIDQCIEKVTVLKQNP